MNLCSLRVSLISAPRIMSSTRNLVECCQSNNYQGLLKGTKQIFGMCEQHGVANPYCLFRDYTEFISNFLRYNDHVSLERDLHMMVWAPRQRALCVVLGYDIREWSSILTCQVGRCKTA